MRVRIIQFIVLFMVTGWALPFVGQAQVPVTRSVTSTSSDLSFGQTNGNRVLVIGSRTLVVAARGASVEIWESLGGLNWQRTHVFADTGYLRCEDPVIASDGYENIGVAWVGVWSSGSTTGRDLRYASRTATGPWSSPVDLGSGNAPSLAGQGKIMHVAWHASNSSGQGYNVYYRNFPTLTPSTSPAATQLNHLPGYLPCFYATRTGSFHTASVTAGRDANGSVRVLVGYLANITHREKFDRVIQRAIGVRVAEVTTNPPIAVNHVFDHFQVVTAATCQDDLGELDGDGISVSLTSGNERFYLAWSDYLTGPGARTLVTRSLDVLNWDAPEFVASADGWLGGGTQVDVAVIPCINNTENELRLAWSFAAAGRTSDRGRVEHLTATWDNTGYTPGPVILDVADMGRAPEALYAAACYPSMCFSSGNAERIVETLFERGTTSRGVAAHVLNDVSECPMSVTCYDASDDRQ